MIKVNHMEPTILKLSKIKIMRRKENDINKVEVNQKELSHEYLQWIGNQIHDLIFGGKRKMKNISFSTSSFECFNAKCKKRKRNR